jgi:hypothetical protein
MTIYPHNFNTEWLDCKSGFIKDLEFFSLQQNERDRLLAEYQWVELRTSQNITSNLSAIHASGFKYVDTQIPFTLNLRNIPPYANTRDLMVERASKVNFKIDQKEIYSFSHERFLALPNVTQEMIDQRYLTMMSSMLAEHPKYSLRIIDSGEVQGWYFGIPNAAGIELSLAMLHKNAHIRGKQLYRKALAIYAEDFSIGTARFSVTNTSVHNILSEFGARFLPPETVWFRIQE